MIEMAFHGLPEPQLAFPFGPLRPHTYTPKVVWSEPVFVAKVLRSYRSQMMHEAIPEQARAPGGLYLGLVRLRKMSIERRRAPVDVAAAPY